MFFVAIHLHVFLPILILMNHARINSHQMQITRRKCVHAQALLRNRPRRQLAQVLVELRVVHRLLRLLLQHLDLLSEERELRARGRVTRPMHATRSFFRQKMWSEFSRT